MPLPGFIHQTPSLTEPCSEGKRKTGRNNSGGGSRVRVGVTSNNIESEKRKGKGSTMMMRIKILRMEEGEMQRSVILSEH